MVFHAVLELLSLGILNFFVLVFASLIVKYSVAFYCRIVQYDRMSVISITSVLGFLSSLAFYLILHVIHCNVLYILIVVHGI